MSDTKLAGEYREQVQSILTIVETINGAEMYWSCGDSEFSKLMTKIQNLCKEALKKRLNQSAL